MKTIGWLPLSILSLAVTAVLLWAAIRGLKACRKQPFHLMVTGLSVVLATEAVSLFLRLAAQT